MHLEWQVKHFSELSLSELHDIIAIRLEAFVVEQNCVYQDLDGIPHSEMLFTSK